MSWFLRGPDIVGEHAGEGAPSDLLDEAPQVGRELLEHRRIADDGTGALAGHAQPELHAGHQATDFAVGRDGASHDDRRLKGLRLRWLLAESVVYKNVFAR